MGELAGNSVPGQNGSWQSASQLCWMSVGWVLLRQQGSADTGRFLWKLVLSTLSTQKTHLQPVCPYSLGEGKGPTATEGEGSTGNWTVLHTSVVWCS